MITSAPPFTATDPVEWVQCYLARRPVAPAEPRKEIVGAVSRAVTG
jgi:hypothetical protein